MFCCPFHLHKFSAFQTVTTTSAIHPNKTISGEKVQSKSQRGVENAKLVWSGAGKRMRSEIKCMSNEKTIVAAIE
jgi:hypothetical protein